MIIRGQFVTELEELKEDILHLGAMVYMAFDEVLCAVKNSDYSKMEEIILNDRKINAAELEINEKATLMIARQQPVAADLRKIIVTLKVSCDLERMGDLIVDIAKSALRIGVDSGVEIFEKEIHRMGVVVKTMLQAVLTAYSDSNVLEAQKVALMDDEVDLAYGTFVQSILEIVVIEQGTTEQVTQLAYISRFIERIADYCTNISEWIIYEANGRRFDLN